MKTYNHAYSLGFSLGGSIDPDGEDVTPAQLKAAIEKRLAELTEQKAWKEAIGCPFDTYEEQPPLQNYTVLGIIEQSGQTVALHVQASGSHAAFTAAARINPALQMVVALPEWQSDGDQLTFPGEGLVDGETVLSQPDVYGDR